MTSKVRPAADYIEPLTEKTWGQGCVQYFGERKNKERNGETSSRMGKYFE